MPRSMLFCAGMDFANVGIDGRSLLSMCGNYIMEEDEIS